VNICSTPSDVLNSSVYASSLARASSLDTQKCRIDKERAKRSSPDVRNQSVSNFPAILFVTGQVPREIPLLIEKPRRDDAAKQHRAHEGPERAQGQRCGKNHQHTARIHWMADDAVGTGRNDTLTRLHFDNARSPSVPLSARKIRLR
jgi:hypothetical protein